MYALFGETCPQVHAHMKRPIAKFYASNGVLPLEPHIDDIISLFRRRLEEEHMNQPNSGRPCDMANWLLYC